MDHSILPKTYLRCHRDGHRKLPRRDPPVHCRGCGSLLMMIKTNLKTLSVINNWKIKIKN
jgi:hypothetical protein